MRLFAVPVLIAAVVTGAGASAQESRPFTLKPIDGGGYAVEHAAAPQTAHGLATIADLVPLLRDAEAAPEKVDFSAGKKLDGVYTIVIGREDGTLAKYEGASDVIVFAAPSSLTTRGDLTTLGGAVVFALKIDNQGAPVAVQRFESGAITLTRARKSL